MVLKTRGIPRRDCTAPGMPPWAHCMVDLGKAAQENLSAHLIFCGAWLGASDTSAMVPPIGFKLLDQMAISPGAALAKLLAVKEWRAIRTPWGDCCAGVNNLAFP